MNDQELAWRGEFGNAYNRRSPGNEDANVRFFEKAFNDKGMPESIVELGAGQGANIRALRRLAKKLGWPDPLIAAVEINGQACEVLTATSGQTEVHHASLLEWQPERTYELAFTKGVLIHIHPEFLGMAYETLHRASRKWILLAEYYNPSPTTVLYRGEENRLWKRDFAGEMLDRYQDLRLVDYGFIYKRDPQPQDDITWFLMEKK